MKAVAQDESSLKRLIEIMNYEDNEYYLYRVFIANASEITKEGEFFTVMIEGVTAWSTLDWFNDCEKYNRTFERHLTSLDYLCERFNIAVEIFSSFPGIERHVTCTHLGVAEEEHAEWAFVDENLNCIEVGGLDNYGQFKHANLIW